MTSQLQRDIICKTRMLFIYKTCMLFSFCLFCFKGSVFWTKTHHRARVFKNSNILNRWNMLVQEKEKLDNNGTSLYFIVQSLYLGKSAFSFKMKLYRNDLETKLPKNHDIWCRPIPDFSGISAWVRNTGYGLQFERITFSPAHS